MCGLAGRSPFGPGENTVAPVLKWEPHAEGWGLPSRGSQKMGGVKSVEGMAGLTMWWLLFPHQGRSSSSWWASWAHRTANTLSATQNTSEIPQRHRLELCRDTGAEMATGVGVGGRGSNPCGHLG